MAKKTHATGNHKVSNLERAGHDPKDLLFSKPGGGHSVRSAMLRGMKDESEKDAVVRLAKAGWDIDSVKYHAEEAPNGTLVFHTKAFKDAEAKKTKGKK